MTETDSEFHLLREYTVKKSRTLHQKRWSRHGVRPVAGTYWV